MRRNGRVFTDDRDKKRKIIIIAAIAVWIIIIILLLARCTMKKTDANANTYTQDPLCTYGPVEGRTDEEIIDDLNRKVDEGMMNISMNLSPVFENGASEGNLLIYNADINRYPQIVEIYLKDSGKLIYASGAIDVGYRIERAPLLVCLESGEYPCTAYFTSVDPATGEHLGKAGADINIIVLN